VPLTPQQSLTITRLAPAAAALAVLEAIALWGGHWAWAVAGLVLFGVYALYVEILAVLQGGESTESELTWSLWARQPWVPWLVSVELSIVAGFVLAQHFRKDVLVLVCGTLLTGFLCGHFFAQQAKVYVALRRERRQRTSPPPGVDTDVVVTLSTAGETRVIDSADVAPRSTLTPPVKVG
jgi:hypothetical protein